MRWWSRHKTRWRKLEKLTKDVAVLSNMRQEIAAAEQAQAAAPEPVEEISVEEIETPALDATAVEPAVEPAIPEPAPGVLDALVNDLESSLGDGFLPDTGRWLNPLPDRRRRSSTQNPRWRRRTRKPARWANSLPIWKRLLATASCPKLPRPSRKLPRCTWLSRNQSQWRKLLHGFQFQLRTAEVVTPMVSGGAAAAAAPALDPKAAPATAAPTFTYQPSKIRPLGIPTPAAAPKIDSAAGIDLADMFGESEAGAGRRNCDRRRRS